MFYNDQTSRKLPCAPLLNYPSNPPSPTLFNNNQKVNNRKSTLSPLLLPTSTFLLLLSYLLLLPTSTFLLPLSHFLLLLSYFCFPISSYFHLPISSFLLLTSKNGFALHKSQRLVVRRRYAYQNAHVVVRLFTAIAATGMIAARYRVSCFIRNRTLLSFQMGDGDVRRYAESLIEPFVLAAD